MFSLRPITARIARRFVTDGFLRGAETVEIDAAARVERAPALFLSDELERIVGHTPGQDPQKDMERLLHSSRIEPATRAMIVSDVLVADGTLLRLTGLDVPGRGPRRAILRGDFPIIPEALLCTQWVIEHYFGHWIGDGWSREQLAIDRGLVPAVFDPARYGHAPGYRALTGLHAVGVANTRIARLWVLDDCGYNPGRLGRYNRVRERLRAAVPSGGPTRVFIRRGATAVGRQLLNEDEVTAALAARGFAIVAPEEMTAAQIAATLRDARIVVGVEGSALAHANAALDAGACVFAIQPPKWFNSVHRLATAGAGQLFGFTVADPAADDSFTMPIDRLCRAIDMVAETQR